MDSRGAARAWTAAERAARRRRPPSSARRAMGRPGPRARGEGRTRGWCSGGGGSGGGRPGGRCRRGRQRRWSPHGAERREDRRRTRRGWGRRCRGDAEIVARRRWSGVVVQQIEIDVEGVGVVELDRGRRLARGVHLGRRRRILAEAPLRALHVPLVRAVLDLAHDAHPVRVERAVALDDRLELEADAGVADLLAPQHPDAAVDVLLRDGRRDLLDPHEVLVVEDAQALEPELQLVDMLRQFLRVHVGERW